MQKSKTICPNMYKQLKNCLMFLCLVIFCGKVYGSDEDFIFCNKDQYYPGNFATKCLDCSNLDTGIAKCDTNRKENFYVKIGSHPAKVFYQRHKGKVWAWNWTTRQYQEVDKGDIPVPARRYTAYMLDAFGPEDVDYLNACLTLCNIVEYGNLRFLPGDEILDSKLEKTIKCPYGFFAFGAKHCVKDGVEDVRAPDNSVGLSEDTIDDVKMLTYDEVKKYNSIKEKENELPTDSTDTNTATYNPKVSYNSEVLSANKSLDIACPVGHIWDNGKCEACSSKPAAWLSYAKEYRMYCPGVSDISLPITSQLKKCPNGAWPNNDLTDCECGYNLKKDEEGNCVGTLSYNDLYYGPFGSSAQLFRQCWTKVSAKAYKKCMGFD